MRHRGRETRGGTGRPWAAALALVLLPAPARAIDTSEPAALIRDVLALYGKEGKGLGLTGPGGRRVLAPELLALVKADAKAAKGEVGALGADPVCDCQDYDITEVRTAATPLGPSRAEVRATFRNFGQPQTMRYSLTRTAGGWRLADVRSEGMSSLVDHLRKALGR